jgi:streptogramin lyase
MLGRCKVRYKTEKMKSLFFCVRIIAWVFMAVLFLGVAGAEARTYTTDADFNEGILVGVEHETVHDQLQLSKKVVTLPFIWVPNDNGTVSKVSTNTGDELGRYMVAPYEDCSPSRTTVDLQGDCWVGNRQAGTVVKIGLYESGHWIDRNGDGICQTSQDLNHDGDITGSEILPWGQDECVLYEVVLIPGEEGTYEPNTYTGGYDYAYWGTAPRGLAVDANNNLWAGTWSSSKYYYINGTTGAIIRSVDVSPHNAYGAAIDKNGILWSAEGPNGDQDNIILRLDTSTNSISFHDLGHTCYGLGLDYNNHLWVSSYRNGKMSRVDILANPPTFVTYDVPEQSGSRGVACTSDNNVWVANTGASTVTRYDNDGNLLATITGLDGPTGVAVDAAGKVWACDYGDEYIHRIEPATNAIDLSKLITESLGHYTYSDMTGIVARTITTEIIGTWTVIYDSGTQNSHWGRVSWTSYEPEGTSVKVKVRSSNDMTNWSAWETADNGVALSATPNGQYLQIETTFQIIAGDVSPILYDLTVSPAKYAGGSGTADDPYQIGSAADLLALAANTNDYNKCFILTADIDLSSYSFTTAVIAPDTNDVSTPPGVPAFDGTAFTGTFGGAEHKILNLTINTNGAGNDYLGLFGKIDTGGKIKNLGLENVSITSGDYSHYLGGQVGWLRGTISNCYSTGSVTGGNSSYYPVGGLVGCNYGGNIINCHSTVAVTGKTYLGGLVGYNYFGSTSITIVNPGTIINCYSTGSVSSVSGSSAVGGLVGRLNGTIINCYSKGTVTDNGGGLVGWYESGYIINCYFLDTSGPDNGYGTPLTDAQMKQQSSFVGWDFVYVWQISEGVSYPQLRVPGTYSGGSGTASDPYQITTVEDLLTLAGNMGHYDEHFILTADINLDSYSFTTAVIAPDMDNTEYPPYMLSGIAFEGTFDGAGHKIINLTINTNGVENYLLGLFGYVSGVVTNLGVENVHITGGDSSCYVGGLAGIGGTISNCHSTGIVTAGDESERLGGLVGRSGTISNCYSTVSVTGHSRVGGLEGTGYTISNCYSLGDVIGTDNVGGLVGWGNSSISNCYSLGDVTGTHNVGGLVGWNWSGAIRNCYATGNVSSGGDCVGGLVGVIGSANPAGTVANCYSTGNVSGTNYVGGLVGYLYQGGVDSSYFLDVSGPNNGYGTPLTDAQMKQQSSFVGWDFLTIWNIVESQTYPFFRWAYSAVDQPWPGHVPAATILAILSLAPNPFSPSTEVSLQSRVSGPVTMEIYDVSGKLVRSVLLGDLGPGLHRAKWDGRDAGGANVSSGVYFIRVRNPVAGSRPVKAVLVR